MSYLEKKEQTRQKISREYADFQREMLLQPKEVLFQQAFQIVAYGEAETFLHLYLETASAGELEYLSEQDDLLFRFYQYYRDLEAGEVNEEVIREFIQEERENRVAEPGTARKAGLPYSTLSPEAKERAYQEALAYIEAEFAEEEEILRDKEQHARDEAEKGALYHPDGSLADLV